MAAFCRRCNCRLSVLSRVWLVAVLFFHLLPVPVEAGKDYYAILGVSKKANDKDIRRAYKKQAMKWHPDKHQKNKEKATAKFQDIAEAYETLTDAEKRKLYDLGGEEAVKGQPQGQSEPNMQGAQFAQGRANGPEIDPAMFEAYFRKMSSTSGGNFKASGSSTGNPGGDPFSFVFMQMPGMQGFDQKGSSFSQGRQSKKTTQGGPLYSHAGSAVREIGFEDHESEIQKLQRSGGAVALFYASGGKSCPKACHEIQRFYEDFAKAHREQMPIVAVQCLRRKGHCATHADKFPAVVLFGKEALQPRILSHGKAASGAELQKSLDTVLGKLRSPQGGVEELSAEHFSSDSDPCGGQFCLLLLEHGSKVASARDALREAAGMLKNEPVKAFYVQAAKNPDFVAAFGAAAGTGLLRGKQPAAAAVIYRPRRQTYEMFDGNVQDAAALAEFVTKVVNRGTPLPHRVPRNTFR